jgi:hypothetical protein
MQGAKQACRIIPVAIRPHLLLPRFPISEIGSSPMAQEM